MRYMRNINNVPAATLGVLVRVFYGLPVDGLKYRSPIITAKYNGWMTGDGRVTEEGLRVLVHYVRPLPHRVGAEVNAVPTNGGSKLPLEQVL